MILIIQTLLNMDLTKSCDMTVMVVGGKMREGGIRTKFPLFVVGIQYIMIQVKNQEITMNMYFKIRS